MNWVLTGLSGSLLTSIAAAVAGSIVLLYVLRVRRRRIEVPFSPLWQKVLEAQQATHLWQRLKRVVSLLLHLLLAALLLGALTDPRKQGDLEEGRSVVILVDTSASMATLDETGARRRIDRALEETEELVRGLGPKDEVMLVRMDGQLRPLTPFVNDPDTVIEALRGIETTATAANVDEAMSYAIDALASRPRGEIVMVTDGAFPDDAREAVPELPNNIDLYGVLVGQSTDNIGITAFNVRRYPANRTNYEVYVRVENFSDADVTAELEIYGEGRLVEVQEIPLAPGAAELRIYPELPSAGGHLSAQVRVVAGDVVDHFAEDDVAYALMPRRGPVRVLLVTAGNLYLEGPFLLNESLETTIIRPEDYVAPNGGDPSAGYDVTVFDRVTPPTADYGNFLYIHPDGEFSPWAIEGQVVDPIIHSYRRDHPLMSWIGGFRDVNILSAQRLDLGRDDNVIAGAIGGAGMIVTRETPTQRLLAVAFGIEASDFPLRVGFPVFLLNAVDWFTQESAGLLESFRTGETWMIAIDDRAATEVEVTTPSGDTRLAQAYDGTAVLYGEAVGFHTLHFGDGSTYEIAGNLANRDESRVAPATELVLGGVTATSAFAASPPVSTFDPWVWLALLALGLLLIEWWTWNRRLTV